MRGLKLCLMRVAFTMLTSHLLQMRGLKHLCLDREHHRHKVASFTDAWIETKRGTTTREIGSVASFTDAWIETKKEGEVTSLNIVASFTDAWIETSW